MYRKWVRETIIAGDNIDIGVPITEERCFDFLLDRGYWLGGDTLTKREIKWLYANEGSLRGYEVMGDKLQTSKEEAISVLKETKKYLLRIIKRYYTVEKTIIGISV